MYDKTCQPTYSGKLEREIWLPETLEEARRLWREVPESRKAIYRKEEVRLLRGAETDTLLAVQSVKEAFPGSTVMSATDEGGRLWQK